jgi:hypothetical protein
VRYQRLSSLILVLKMCVAGSNATWRTCSAFLAVVPHVEVKQVGVGELRPIMFYSCPGALEKTVKC